MQDSSNAINQNGALAPNPGDDAPAGTVGTGEDTCPRCGGSGMLAASQACPDCDGTGIVIQGIGGG